LFSHLLAYLRRSRRRSSASSIGLRVTSAVGAHNISKLSGFPHSGLRDVANRPGGLNSASDE